MGIWDEIPFPTPRRIWNPTYFPVDEPMSRVYIAADPAVRKAPPIMRTGLKYPIESTRRAPTKIDIAVKCQVSVISLLASHFGLQVVEAQQKTVKPSITYTLL